MNLIFASFKTRVNASGGILFPEIKELREAPLFRAFMKHLALGVHKALRGFAKLLTWMLCEATCLGFREAHCLGAS